MRNQGIIRRGLFAALGAVAALVTGLPGVAPAPGAAAVSAAVQAASSFVRPQNGFDWSAPRRFGPDANRDGITDYHWNARDRVPEHGGAPETYDPAWVQPRSFRIDFDGCATAEDAARADAGQATEMLYEWEINGERYAG